MPIFSRRTLASTALLIASGSPLPAFAAEDDQAITPNILFLLVDDQRNDTLGCAGHDIIRTPEIDRLAAEGVRFRNAFVTTSICAASRASILTGLHERTHGYTFGTEPISAAHMATSYPALLRQAGYHTGFIGKFGVATAAAPNEVWFDVYQPHGLPFIKTLPDGTKRHETQIAGDRAVAFLRDLPEGAPFCLSISFNAAHADDGNKEDHYPWPQVVDGLYDDMTIPPPRLAAPEYFDALPPFLRTSLNRRRFFWRWDTPEKYQKNMKGYYRMISGIDHVVGRIRRQLESLDLDDNTVIIYTADNGYYMGDRGFAGKWSHFEQSLRVPLIVYDPHLPEEDRGQVRSEIALNIDLAPTFLALAGVESPELYQGRSVLPLLQKGETAADWRTDFFCEHLMEHRDIPKWEGVRGERYVYACYFEQSPAYEFLHDLQSDPDQLRNLASDPECEDVLDRMRARCDALKRRYLPANIETADDATTHAAP
jgi:arylsulfatase A-like enzyme